MFTAFRIGCVVAVVALLSVATFIGLSRPALPQPVTEPEPTPWFTDVTADVGLDFVHVTDSAVPYFMPRIAGSGVGVGDFDNDGLLDLYLVQNGGPKSNAVNRLYRQGADGRFVDVSTGSGLDVAGYGMGVAVGDVNNDGWAEVLLTEYGGTRLFRNRGNGTFAELPAEAGIDRVSWGTSAGFVDFDRDGWLDVVVVNYLDYDASRPCAAPSGLREFCGPKYFPGSVTKLYRNLGRSAGATPVEGVSTAPIQFEDVTVSSGLAKVFAPGLGLFCADFTGDGWTDLFVANDGYANHLWINQQNGTFLEEAVLRGVAYNGMGEAEANMGVAIGDADGDGLFDLYVTHLSEESNRLWVQGPQGLFQDQTAQAGLMQASARGTGFGTLFGDFDLDGLLDLAVANGRVARRAGVPPPAVGDDVRRFWADYEEGSQLFANAGAGRMRDISLQNEPFCGTPRVARGLACADFDGDGDLDLLQTTIDGPARIFRNVAPRRGHWLLVRAIDPMLQRDAYGAEITIHAGARQWKRWANPAYSYLCSNDPRCHFGLGPVERVDSIRVLWPDGMEESFAGGPVDRVLALRKGEGAEH
jgi:hypothetical protein